MKVKSVEEAVKFIEDKAYKEGYKDGVSVGRRKGMNASIIPGGILGKQLKHSKNAGATGGSSIGTMPKQGSLPTFGDIFEKVTSNERFVQMMVIGVSEGIITIGELKVEWTELSDTAKWKYVRNITD